MHVNASMRFSAFFKLKNVQTIISGLGSETILEYEHVAAKTGKQLMSMFFGSGDTNTTGPAAKVSCWFLATL